MVGLNSDGAVERKMARPASGSTVFGQPLEPLRLGRVERDVGQPAGEDQGGLGIVEIGRDMLLQRLDRAGPILLDSPP